MMKYARLPVISAIRYIVWMKYERATRGCTLQRGVLGSKHARQNNNNNKGGRAQQRFKMFQWLMSPFNYLVILTGVLAMSLWSSRILEMSNTTKWGITVCSQGSELILRVDIRGNILMMSSTCGYRNRLWSEVWNSVIWWQDTVNLVIPQQSTKNDVDCVPAEPLAQSWWVAPI